MDIVFIAAIACLFVLTLGMASACAKLGERT